MPHFKTNNAEIFYTASGDADTPAIIWAHGWGQNGAAFEQMIQPFTKSAKHYAVDFPGFGESPEPPESWGTEDYADAMAQFIKENITGKVLWVGHSFGCRVGLQIAARHPELIERMFLIAGAGLKRKRPLHKQLYFKARILTYKLLKKLSLINLVSKDWLTRTFGSRDYQNSSGIMRQVFVKVVNEDLSPQARAVACPVTLVYGENDTETPPEIGQRLNKLISNSEMVHLSGQDHYSVLAQGRHQVAPLLKKFIET